VVGALLALAVLGLGACSGSDEPEAAPTTTVDPSILARRNTEESRAALCKLDYEALRDAVEAYRDAEEKEPTTLRFLVPKYLSRPSASWRIVIVEGKARIEPSAAGIEVGCKVPKGE
jgi:hypothetical protein